MCIVEGQHDNDIHNAVIANFLCDIISIRLSAVCREPMARRNKLARNPPQTTETLMEGTTSFALDGANRSSAVYPDSHPTHEDRSYFVFDGTAMEGRCDHQQVL